MVASRLLKIVSHVYGTERAGEVRPALPDPVDLDGDGTLLARLGLTLEDFADAEGIKSVTATTFDSAAELAQALRRAAGAHDRHEKRTGAADPNWPDWYADYMVREQAGESLPT